jgi:hypothetical protein
MPSQGCSAPLLSETSKRRRRPFVREQWATVACQRLRRYAFAEDAVVLGCTKAGRRAGPGRLPAWACRPGGKGKLRSSGDGPASGFVLAARWTLARRRVGLRGHCPTLATHHARSALVCLRVDFASECVLVLPAEVHRSSPLLSVGRRLRSAFRQVDGVTLPHTSLRRRTPHATATSKGDTPSLHFAETLPFCSFLSPP